MAWKEHQLREFIEIKHGWAFKGEYFAENGKYILLTPGNAYESGGLKLKGDKEKYYTGEFPEEFLLKSGDMLVVMTDLIQAAPILGASLIIPQDDCFLHNQRLGLIQIKDEANIDSRFLYHSFNTPAYRSQVRATATGATVRHTSPGRICNCRVLVPDQILEQKQIASILDSYDDLIALNQRRIQLLEESARLLYREWFVKLRFPGYENVAVKDRAPEGWKRQPLEKFCDDIRDAVDPSEVEPDRPYLSMEHMPQRSLCLDTWDNAEKVQSTKLKFTKNDILFGKIRPYFHKVGLAFINGITSTDVIVIRAKQSNFLPIVAMVVSSDEFVSHAVATSNGTKMPRADWKVLRKWPVLTPSDELLITFEGLVKPIFEQLQNLCFQNRVLKQARDLLLPKLMSGALDVSRIALPDEATV